VVKFLTILKVVTKEVVKMPEKILAETKEKMKKAVNVFSDELATIRTGRASPSVLQGIKVDYYGNLTPLNQIASITAPEPDLLLVHPWDKNILNTVEKAILSSDLGLNPSNDGNVIRIPIPPLTEERRKEIVKMVKKLAEEARIAVRNIRRGANDDLKKRQKTGDISEDDEKRLEKRIQELTDENVQSIDNVLKEKEKEILEE